MRDPAHLTVHYAPESSSPRQLALHGAASAEADAAITALWTPPAENWVRMNMIGSINGRVTGPDGTSDSLSNRADRRILQAIRRMSDAVIVGAQTVRQERHTSTRPTHLVIVTSSGDLTGHRISEEDAEASVLVCAPASARGRVEATMPGAELVECTPDDGKVPLETVLATLRERGLHQLVVEGGADLIGQFLEEGRIDEICVTQAPTFGSIDSPSLPGSGTPNEFERILLAEDSEGFLYQRLVRR